MPHKTRLEANAQPPKAPHSAAMAIHPREQDKVNCAPVTPAMGRRRNPANPDLALRPAPTVNRRPFPPQVQAMVRPVPVMGRHKEILRTTPPTILHSQAAFPASCWIFSARSPSACRCILLHSFSLVA